MESLQSALDYLNAGDFSAAEKQIVMALDIAPDHVDALSIYGVILNASGQYSKAARVFQRLARLAPGETAHWLNLGTALRADNRLDEALVAYQQAAALGERSADFLLNLGLLHFDRSEYSAAEAVLAQAISLSPRDAEMRLYFAKSCYEGANGKRALESLENWRDFEGWTTELFSELGTVLLELGKSDEAEVVLNIAIESEPSNLLPNLRLIQLMERTNRVAAAEALLSALPLEGAQALKYTDEIVAVRAGLAARNNDHVAAKKYYSELVSLSRRAELKHHAQFLLAKSLDAMNDYAQAYQVLLQAHDSRMAALNRNSSFNSTMLTSMPLADYPCDPADVVRWDLSVCPPTEESPIFIVAFPRSGTTLLEQVLDAHPMLRSMDEQPYLQNVIQQIALMGVAYPDRLADLSQQQLEQLRKHYWSLVAGSVDMQPGQRLVDKNPLNLLRLPLIRRIFPNARIVLCVRHPCDVILSCYMQHFRSPELAITCRSLPALAQGYRRAFDFWYAHAEILKPAVFELRYESFVVDFERHVKMIANFVEIPWDDAMLKPAEHAQRRGYISTPSYSQVVNPVSDKAVNRWRHYRDYMQDIIGDLQPYLQRWHYEA